MNKRSIVMAISLIVLLYISGGERMASAQQGTGSQQGQPPMTPLNGPAYTQLTDSQKSLLVDRLDLKAYEAARGDLSICADDKNCQEDAKDIKIWECVSSLCNGKDNTREPITCFGDALNGKSEAVLNQINASICPLIKSPGPDTRKAFLNSIDGQSTATEADEVENGAYVMALQGSAKLCEKYIKDYIGAFGPRWNHHWYRALSGCRILAGNSTREKEDKYFFTWFGVPQGLNKCTDIPNYDFNTACKAPKAGSPFPGNVH